MKYFLTGVVTFQVLCFISLRAAWPAPNSSDSGVYQWTDESGTVNFSDNPTKNQGKYGKGVKKRDSLSGQVSPSEVQKEDTEIRRSVNPAVILYGGQDENSWRRRFSDLRSQIRMIKEALPEKNARLRVAHIKKAATDSIGGPSIYAGNHWSNRVIYKELYYEIKGDEERVTALEKELDALDIEASRAGVPSAWRE